MMSKHQSTIEITSDQYGHCCALTLFLVHSKIFHHCPFYQYSNTIQQQFFILIFPAASGKPVLGQLVDDYLLDFDIFHVSNVTELLHYVDQKYLAEDLGGQAVTDVDQWLLVQVRDNWFCTLVLYICSVHIYKSTVQWQCRLEITGSVHLYCIYGRPWSVHTYKIKVLYCPVAVQVTSFVRLYCTLVLYIYNYKSFKNIYEASID